MVLAALVFAIPLAWGLFGDQIKEKLKNMETRPPHAPPRPERPWQTKEDRPCSQDRPVKINDYQPTTPTRETTNHYDALEEEQRRSHRKKYGG